MRAPGRATWRDRSPDRDGAGGPWRLVLLALAVVVQLAVLYSPRQPSVGGLSSVDGLDKLVHAGVFALVVVAGRAAHLPRLLLVLLTVVQAPVSELLQATLLPHRSGDPWDVVADLAGCVLGWWLTTERR